MKEAILCSMGWFERKLFVVSMVAGVRIMSISKCQCYDVCTLPTVFFTLLRISKRF